MNDLALFQFIITEQNLQQRAFASPIATNESDLHVVDQRDVGTVEQNLVTESFVGVADLDQNCHCNQQNWGSNRGVANKNADQVDKLPG